MSFKEKLYEIIPNALSKDVIQLVTANLGMIRENVLQQYKIKDDIEYDPYSYCDVSSGTVRNTFGIYAPLITETLLFYLQPQIEKITGVSLYPTYSFARYYYYYGKMIEHVDRPSCEYSATVCLANDPDYGPYKIFFRDQKNEPFSIDLNDGDALVYKGDILPHWRETYEGKKHLQTFLHYVDKNGPYSHYKYDKRANLGCPASKQIIEENKQYGRDTQHPEVQFAY